MKLATDDSSANRLHWPERALGPAPGLKEFTIVCWMCLICFVLVPLGLVVSQRAHAGLDVPDADFVNFYAMGRILNNYPAEQLYNYELQTQVRTAIHPLRSGQYGPLPHPPMVALLFRPLALLSYTHAYVLWLMITLSLYLAGLWIATHGLDGFLRSLVICLSLAFYPFIIETLLNGQLTAIIFFTLTLAFRFEERGQPMATGLALSVLLVKPTLLLWFLPMLFLTRRYRILFGFAAGAATLFLVTSAVQGLGVWTGYFPMLWSFTKTTSGATSILPLTKYVDLSAFATLLGLRQSAMGRAALIVFTFATMVALVRMWWTSGKLHNPTQQSPRNTLMWAATLTWTLVLNGYVPIYDTILIVLSAVVTIRVLRHEPPAGGPMLGRLYGLSLLLCAVSWVTISVAQNTGVQSITLAIAIFGIVQVKLWAYTPNHCVINSRPREPFGQTAVASGTEATA